MTFCKYRNAVKSLHRPKVVIAACLYLAFDKPFVPSVVLPKSSARKRKSSAPQPQKKRLRRMNLKKPVDMPRRRFSRLSNI